MKILPIIAIVSLSLFANSARAAQSGGGVIFGITALKDNEFVGAMKQQQIALKAEYLGTVEGVDILRASAEDLNAINTHSAYPVTLRGEGKIIRTFIVNSSKEEGFVTLRTLDGKDIVLQSERAESDPKLDETVDEQPVTEGN